MKKLALLPFYALFFGGSTFSTTAEEEGLKTASVNMVQLVQEFHKTKTLQKLVEVEREKVIAELKSIEQEKNTLLGELAKIKEQMDSPSLADDRRQKLYEEHQTKHQQGVQLETAANELAGRRQRAMLEKYKIKVGDLAREIQVVVQQYATDHNYDMIFDKTADSKNGSLPVIMYAKDATDITAIILKEINKTAESTSEKEKPSEESPTPADK